jgi:hypothetical protein
VLDDVEAWRVLEQPAGEHASPFGSPVRSAFLHQDLNEGAFLGDGLPGRGLLARGKPDDDVADPARLTRFHLQLLRDVVALVEQSERRHPLRHRRANRILYRNHRRSALRKVLRNLGLDRFGLRCFVVAGRQSYQERQKRGGAHRQASGVQAS